MANQRQDEPDRDRTHKTSNISVHREWTDTAQHSTNKNNRPIRDKTKRTQHKRTARSQLTERTDITYHKYSHLRRRERKRERKKEREEERDRDRGRDEDLQEQWSPTKPVGHTHFSVAASQVPLPHPPQSRSSVSGREGW